VIVGDATQESVAIVADQGGDHLARIRDGICAVRGKPAFIRTANGPEYTGKAMSNWARRRGIALRLIERGKPNQNAYVERLRGECLNEHWFMSLAHARATPATPTDSRPPCYLKRGGTSSQSRVRPRTRATCRESPGDDGDDDDAAALWLVILSEKIAHSGRARLTAACT